MEQPGEAVEEVDGKWEGGATEGSIRPGDWQTSVLLVAPYGVSVEGG